MCWILKNKCSNDLCGDLGDLPDRSICCKANGKQCKTPQVLITKSTSSQLCTTCAQGLPLEALIRDDPDWKTALFGVEGLKSSPISTTEGKKAVKFDLPVARTGSPSSRPSTPSEEQREAALKLLSLSPPPPPSKPQLKIPVYASGLKRPASQDLGKQPANVRRSPIRSSSVDSLPVYQPPKQQIGVPTQWLSGVLPPTKDPINEEEWRYRFAETQFPKDSHELPYELRDYYTERMRRHKLQSLPDADDTYCRWLASSEYAGVLPQRSAEGIKARQKF